MYSRKTIHVADSSVKDMTQLQSKKASTNSGDIWIQALCVKGCLQTYENYRGICGLCYVYMDENLAVSLPTMYFEQCAYFSTKHAQKHDTCWTLQTVRR